MNFIEFLDEVYVREQGRGYYVLPVRINRKSHMGSVELSKYARNNYAAEIVNCMIDCLDTFCKAVVIILLYKAENQIYPP